MQVDCFHSQHTEANRLFIETCDQIRSQYEAFIMFAFSVFCNIMESIHPIFQL